MRFHLHRVMPDDVLQILKPMPNTGFFRLYPLVPLCLSLAAGIAVARAVGLAHCACWCGAGVAVFLVGAMALRRLPRTQTAAMLLAAFMLGTTLMVLSERSLSVALPKGYAVTEGIVADEPVERGRIVRFDMAVTSGPLAGHSVRVALLKDTVSRRYASIGVGDGLRFSSRLEPPANFVESNFDYVTYLQSRDIVATTFVYYRNWSEASVDRSALTVFQRARIAALRIRHALLSRYRALGLAGQDFAVVAAMTLGDKSALSASTRDVYSVTGASHILALSGMHLGIIYALLSVLSLGRRFSTLRECLLLVAIWAYVLLVGLSPSVLRSALMITVYSIVGLSGRNRMSVNALAFAAFVLLVANPLVLFDIGFQLSFAAVAFILVFHPLVGGIVPYKYQQSHRLVRWAWQLLLMSGLAQAGTLPLVAYYFGRVPLYSLLTNFVVIPAATAILYSAVAMFALAWLPVAQQAVAAVVSVVVSALNSVLSSVASLPCASIDGVRLSALQAVLLYVMMVCLCLFLALLGRRLQAARDLSP